MHPIGRAPTVEEATDAHVALEAGCSNLGAHEEGAGQPSLVHWGRCHQSLQRGVGMST